MTPDESAALARLATALPELTEAGRTRLRFLRFLAATGRHPEGTPESSDPANGGQSAPAAGPDD